MILEVLLRVVRIAGGGGFNFGEEKADTVSKYTFTQNHWSFSLSQNVFVNILKYIKSLKGPGQKSKSCQMDLPK